MHETSDAAAAFVRLNGAGFSRAVSNLLNNAAESMPQARIVELKLLRRGDSLWLSIGDHGCGIAAVNLDKVLGGGVSLGKVQGSGLGLSSARAAVRQWGGHLTIKSKLRVGTTVEIELPCSKPAAWFAPSIEASCDAQIFVLDDDASMARLWAARFTHLTRNRRASVNCYQRVDDFVNAVRACQAPRVCLVDVELL